MPLKNPTPPVSSVAGKVGAVVLAIADVVGLQSAIDAATGSGTRPAHYVWAGPTSGVDAAPTFRLLGVADVINLVTYLNNKVETEDLAVEVVTEQVTALHVKVTGQGDTNATLEFGDDDDVTIWTMHWISDALTVEGTIGVFSFGNDGTFSAPQFSGDGSLLDGVVTLESGRAAIPTPNSAPADGTLANGEVGLYLDESGNNLKVKVKYSGGTVKTATIPLV